MRRFETALITALLFIPLIAAIPHWFVCDDAAIAFRYSRNLLLGHGLVYNPAEYVEGYTSFLWVVEMAALWALGLRPEVAAPATSLVMTVITGLGIVALGRQTSRREVALVALALWATNRSVWVWATSGLEARQFSALFIWAMVLLARPGAAAAAAGSTLVGLAALTRPEALLSGPILLAWSTWDRWRQGEPVGARGLVLRFGPAGALVGGHLLWRRWMYGEWLPNTYYAKNVRPWWDAGGMFLGYAGIEHALWLMLPLAAIGTWAAWRRGQSVHLAMWAWAVPSYVHLAKIGGDHFEFRMLDEWWPVLYLAVADGLAALIPRRGPRLVAAAVTLAYGLVLPLSHARLAMQLHGRGETEAMSVHITPEDSPWIVAFPPTTLLLPTYHAWGDFILRHSIGLRHREHQVFAAQMASRYRAWELADPDGALFPDDALCAEGSIGYLGFHAWDVGIVDIKGLTDYVVARTPVTVPDDKRQLAHDRWPPAGYLDDRGVNIEVEGAYKSVEAALADATHAVDLGELPCGPGDDRMCRFWGAFEPLSDRRGEDWFPGRTVVDRIRMKDPFRKDGKPGDAPRDRFTHEGRTWAVQRWIGRFDDGIDGWTLEGEAFARQPALGTWLEQGVVKGFEGAGLLNSYHPSRKDRATGVATSPPFTAAPGDALSFLRGGGREAAVVLLADGAEVARWNGPQREAMGRVVVALDPWAGKVLQVALRDDSSAGWGHGLLDAVAVVRAD